MLTDAVVESMRPEIGRADFDSSASVSHWQPTFAVRALCRPDVVKPGVSVQWALMRLATSRSGGSSRSERCRRWDLCVPTVGKE